MTKQKLYILILVVLSTGWLIRCDHGLGLLESKITGRLHYLNVDMRPDYVESVRVVALVHFPPQGLGDLVYTNSGVGFRGDESSYDLPAPLATYEMVAAIWRKQGKDWDYSNILGIYGFDPINYTFETIPVTLDKSHPVADSVDIYCDWSLITTQVHARSGTLVGSPKRLE
ncbi:hypothetical protein JXO59_11335 [candidate division KSB1 bacterium]|nr:hypothetical protein [candidate division KSB1 bacterium]